MADAKNGKMIEKICSIILAEYPDGPRDFYMYAEVESGLIAPSMVQVFPDHIFWLVPWNISDAIYALWQSADDDAKWRSMALKIRAGDFTAQFDYEPFEYPEEHTSERAPAVIKAKFPNLPLRHPPFDPDAFSLEVARRRKGRIASFELDPSKDADSGSSQS
jgi:hypothetical protein